MVFDGFGRVFACATAFANAPGATVSYGALRTVSSASCLRISSISVSGCFALTQVWLAPAASASAPPSFSFEASE